MGQKRAMMLGLDGADPIRVKKLIEEGRLPNLKKVMEMGVSTKNLDMLGIFPTVTPPNWTTLATGNYPRTHGITCFQNHTLGKSLGILEKNWDSRRVESELIWEAFEDEGRRCIMLNYCQAWPNRVEGSNNIFIDGTGVIPFLRSTADFQKEVFLSEDEEYLREIPHTVDQNSNDCVVYDDQLEKFAKPAKETIEGKMGGAYWTNKTKADSPMLEVDAPVLMNMSGEELATGDACDKLYSPLKDPNGWVFDVPEEAKEAAITMNKGLARRYVLLTKTDGVYDTITLYTNKKKSEPLGSVKLGFWSDVIYDTLMINEEDVKVAYRLRFISVSEDGSKARFYISHMRRVEDYGYFYPEELGAEMQEAIGPAPYMCSFDRFDPVADSIVVEAFDMINEWHIQATDFLFNKYSDWSLFYIHLHSIDLINHWFIENAVEGSHENWAFNAELIDRVYEVNDNYIGAMLKYLDGNTTIFVTSDHAAIPRSPGYENPGIGELSGINAGVMSELGYTVIEPIGDSGMYKIDWSKTKAINSRTSHIYINLKGRDPEGIVEPEDYEKLVQQIISDLYNYRDPKSGDRVVSFCMTREEMECIGMGGPHCGDIFFQLTRDFGMQHANTPNHVTNHGYSVGCLCMMVGAGLKEGEFIDRPIRNVDIVPTICHLVGNRMPKHVEGGVIYQALKD